MKKITLIAAVILAAFTTNAIAQQESSASVTSTASIVTPIKVVAGTPLNFGTIASGTNGGVVTVATDGTRTLTSGDIALVTTNGDTPTAATFTVTGEANTGFFIQSPTTLTLNKDVSGTMDVALTIPQTLSLNETGTATIPVSAVLTIGAAQPSGTYTNDAGLAVTVYYN